MTSQRLLAVLGIAAIWAGFAAGAQAVEPATQPSSESKPAPYALSDMRIQEAASVPFLCISEQTTSATLQSTIDSMLPKLTKLAKDSSVELAGPCVFVYHGLNSSQSFTLDAGFPVASKTAEFPGFALKQLQAASCATADYHGPTRLLPHAHQTLLNDISAGGHQAGTELREIYLHFSARGDSDVRLQVPLTTQDSILAAHKSTGSPQPTEK